MYVTRQRLKMLQDVSMRVHFSFYKLQHNSLSGERERCKCKKCKQKRVCSPFVIRQSVAPTQQPGGVVLLGPEDAAAAQAAEEGRVSAHEVWGDSSIEFSICTKRRWFLRTTDETDTSQLRVSVMAWGHQLRSAQITFASQMVIIARCLKFH